MITRKLCVVETVKNYEIFVSMISVRYSDRVRAVMENVEKSWNLKKKSISRPGEAIWKSRKMPKVMEKSWKMKIVYQIM